jgi:hypothetical protein
MLRAPSVVSSEVAGSNPRPQHQILSAHQPVYLPGIIIMAKIALSDDFMWVGHCDYQPRSWHSRNYIRGYKSIVTLSVPVVKSSGPSINEKRIDGVLWKDHHLRSLAHNYRKRPFFKDYFPELEAVLLMPHTSLANLNISLAHLFCHWLNIETQIHYSENWNISGRKTAMLVDMCQKMKATDYLSSPGERAYVNIQEMNGYAHHFLKFTHPIYEQGYRDFAPDLSVIDLIFNCGPESGDIVKRCASV